MKKHNAFYHYKNLSMSEKDALKSFLKDILLKQNKYVVLFDELDKICR